MIAQTKLACGGVELPVYSVNTLIVGSGAAGLNCAEHVLRYMEQGGVRDPCAHVAIITAGLGLGTSHNSGSDKQTYYRMGVCGDTPDTPKQLAETLTAFGCMHGDVALCEAESSLREFYHLVENGVPFPHDARGMFVGYKTDHDPRQRATSAGPWTSRFMVQRSLAQLRARHVAIFDKHQLIAVLVAPSASQASSSTGAGPEEPMSGPDRHAGRRCIGAVTIDKTRCDEAGPGLAVWNCRNLVVATGGPGAMYKTSVYPPGQMGTHGVLFEAGCVAHNLTESQFGLASVDPRWNVSGTYQQVVPNYFSTDAQGRDKQFFLNKYFAGRFASPEEAMKALALNIFLKGYQWPFDPDRAANFGSSLIDLLVHNEIMQGRRVFMDFLSNPVASEGVGPFSLENLADEARGYLVKSGALQATPIERLKHMNQPSIDLYAQFKRDVTREPLEVAVCAQHCNGGFKVNRWWETNVAHLFCLGELAGTHGVKRPGGSSLNATQVGGLRAAQYLTHRYNGGIPALSDFKTATMDQLAAVIDKARQLLRQGESARQTIKEVREQIQERMSRCGGFVRSQGDLTTAVNEAQSLRARIREQGLKLSRRGDLPQAIETEQMCLTHLAYLAAMKELIARGGGSRGSHMVAAADGIEPHPMLGTRWRFKPENESLRDEILEAWLGRDDAFHFAATSVRPIPPIDAWFENTWAAYREGRIYL